MTSLITFGVLLEIAAVSLFALVSYVRRSASAVRPILEIPRMPDVWIARVGLGLLGLVSIVGALGIILVSAQGREVPPSLAGLTGSSVSTLGVVVIALIRTTNGKNPPSAQL